MKSGDGGTEKEVKQAPSDEPQVDPPADDGKEETERSSPAAGTDTKGPVEPPESPAPMAQPTAYPQLYVTHLTPQQGGGYYMYSNAQVTPEPPSPAGYDASSFRHQQFNPFGGQYAGGLPPPPLSPRVGSMGSLPPPSPLFPRVTSNAAGRLSPGGNGAPPSPGPYLASPGLGPGMYQPYSGSYNPGNGPGSDASAEDISAWAHRYGGVIFWKRR